MDISFSCTNCGQRLEVDASGAGMTVPCPTCQTDLIVPTNAPDVPPARPMPVAPRPSPPPIQPRSEEGFSSHTGASAPPIVQPLHQTTPKARKARVRLKHLQKQSSTLSASGNYRITTKEYLLSPIEDLDRPSRGTDTYPMLCSACGGYCNVKVLSVRSQMLYGLSLFFGSIALEVVLWWLVWLIKPIPVIGVIYGIVVLISVPACGLAALCGLGFLAGFFDVSVENSKGVHEVEIVKKETGS